MEGILRHNRICSVHSDNDLAGVPMKSFWSAVDKLFKVQDEVFAEAEKVMDEHSKNMACKTCGSLIDGRFLEEHRAWHRRIGK